MPRSARASNRDQYRFDERYHHLLGPFTRPLQRRILDKMYVGEGDTDCCGKSSTRCACVLGHDVPVLVRDDARKRDLATVMPPEEWRLAKNLRWRRWMLRQTIALANPHDKRLGRRVTNAHVFQTLAT